MNCCGGHHEQWTRQTHWQTHRHRRASTRESARRGVDSPGRRRRPQQERPLHGSPDPRRDARTARPHQGFRLHAEHDGGRVAAPIVVLGHYVVGHLDVEIVHHAAVGVVGEAVAAHVGAVGAAHGAKADGGAGHGAAHGRAEQRHAPQVAAQGVAAGHAGQGAGSLDVDAAAAGQDMVTKANLDQIIAASVEPLKGIDSIKIVDVSGLGSGNNGGGQDGETGRGGNLADQVVESAMRYRAQAPLIDSILKEVGLGGVTPSQMGLAGMLEQQTPVEEASKPTLLSKNK